MKFMIPPFSKWISMCCLVLTSLPAPAQIGFKCGLSASSFTSRNTLVPEGDYQVDLRPYLGYDIEWVQLGAQKPVFSPVIGLYYPLRILKRLAVVPELSFLQKGVSFNQSEYEPIIYQVRTTYVEVPLSVSFSYLTKEKSRSDIYFGGYGACKIRAVKRTATHFSPLEATVLHNVNRFEAGIHGGINYERAISGRHFLIDLRIFYGLTPIFSLPEGQVSIYREVQSFSHTGLQISIGYEI